LFSFYLSLEKVPQQILNIVSGLPFSNVIILAVLLVVYIILGMMMNQAAILILTLPITYPLAINLGYDPIWFGVIIVKTVEIGMVSPPFGLNVFVATGPLDINVDVAFRGAVRFIAADIVVIILLVAFPEIAHIVPDLLTG
jgi:TRAP-type C4-dicarboxylate transport system permease large subunit